MRYWTCGSEHGEDGRDGSVKGAPFGHVTCDRLWICEVCGSRSDRGEVCICPSDKPYGDQWFSPENNSYSREEED